MTFIRPVCRNFDRSALKLLESIKYLDRNAACFTDNTIFNKLNLLQKLILVLLIIK